MKTKAFALIFALSMSLAAQEPNDPKPKAHEPLKFAAAVAFFGGSTVSQVLAQHNGAKLCKFEDRFEPGKFGTADGYGRRPDNADRRELYLTAGVIVASSVFEFTGHRKIAKRILIFGGTANYGVAGATYWAGCN